MAGQQIGRLGKLFCKEEATYGAAVVLAATDAFRHLDIGFRYNLNRSNSLEKKGTPGLSNRFSRHIEAGFDLRSAYLSPSGTIQTAPEAKAILKNSFGAEVVGTLSTTVASGGAVGGATLTSATGLNVGDVVLINCTGGSFPGRYARFIKSISGAAVTWGPDLPQAPANADTVKQGVTYKLANDIPKSLTLARYLPDVSYELKGAVVEKLQLMFDGNDEVKIAASGPAQVQTRPAQAQPGAFTTVGQPVTGISGYFYLDGTAFKITKANIEVNNLLELINDSYGNDRAESYYRGGRRDVTFSLDARLTDDQAAYAAAEAASDTTLMIQAGKTEGAIIAVYAPRAEFDIPDVPDDDGAIRLSYRGACKETLLGLNGAGFVGNDELILGFC